MTIRYLQTLQNACSGYAMPPRCLNQPKKIMDSTDNLPRKKCSRIPKDAIIWIQLHENMSINSMRPQEAPDKFGVREIARNRPKSPSNMY
jgi:hypothetical protein